MKYRRHFAPTDRAWELERISALIADIDRVVRILDSDIALEKEKARLLMCFEPVLPPLATALIARRDKLKETIAALERRIIDLQEANGSPERNRESLAE